MGGSLQQPPAAMLEISRRHSVMLHGSCIPSFEIERATMNCHDQRGPSRASLHGLRSEVGFERKPTTKYEGVLPPFLQGTGWSKKKRTPGPIFGSPVAGTPVRRGGTLACRPATAAPPGATPKPICACFMRPPPRGRCTKQLQSLAGLRVELYVSGSLRPRASFGFSL